MNFQELQYHVEEMGCEVDHFEDNTYFVRNKINGKHCIIERHSPYSAYTICHYCQTLGISAPEDYYEEMAEFLDYNKNKLPEEIANHKLAD